MTEMEAKQPPVAGDFASLVALMQRLRGPDGCAWDREQTLDSIQPHTLEEVYEVFDAIDRRAWAELQNELGDLLLQVIFYAQIASDEDRFDIADVVRGLSSKLIRRHPHVFGDAQAGTAADVLRTWEQVKRGEHEARGLPNRLLDTVPRSMPAMLEASKLGSRAAKVGFDWASADEVFAKVEEEVAELRAEMTAEPDAERVEEELGDLLFVLTNLARHLRVDPEQALRRANGKFRSRFATMEVRGGGTENLRRLSAAELEELWLQAKLAERAGVERG